MAVLDHDILQYHSQNIMIILALPASVSFDVSPILPVTSPAEPIMPVKPHGAVPVRVRNRATISSTAPPCFFHLHS